MNVIIIGTGFVGATHAAVLASYGHCVFAYDVNEQRIQDLASKDPTRIDSCIYEPGLANLIKTHPIKFTNKLEEIPFSSADIIFLCLPTPAEELTLPDEKKHLFISLEQIAEHLKKRGNSQTNHITIVNKSTAPIGTVTKIMKILIDKGIKNFGVASNPEFLVEGKAIQGSLHPDRIIIGVNTSEDEHKLKALYIANASQIITVKPKDAEAIKLLANFELFSTVIRTFQITGRLCEIEDLCFENVIKGITADSRIPKWGHYTSLYAGGSCFEKDAYNLLHTMKEKEHSKTIIQSVIDGNTKQLEDFYKRAAETGFNWKEKKVALLGTAFKQDTNDVRKSSALTLTEWLLRDGATIHAYDPQALQNYRKQYPDERVKMCSSATEAIQGTQAAIICTDWPEFKNIELQAPYLLMDGRRSLANKYEEFFTKGITIIAVGSPTMMQQWRD